MSRPAARLGRGLASLIPDSALDVTDPNTVQRSSLRVVPLDEIRPNPEQPREVFDTDALEDLANSIRTHGVLSPLVVRRAEGRYILIAGERRLRASALAGLVEVPVVVRDAPGSKEQLELALVENLQRSDLDPVETARGYQRLASEFAMRQDEIAKRVGRDRSTIANIMRLLKLPDFALNALRDGRISSGHARALIPLADAPDDLRRLLAKVVAQKLNVRATEKMVSQLLATPQPMRTATRQKREQTFEYATKLLSQALHTAVNIRPRANGGGKITIDYANADELERLIQQMRESS